MGNRQWDGLAQSLGWCQIFPLCSALFATLLWGVPPSMAIEKENAKMSAENLEQRGKQLRAELEQAYRDLSEAKNFGKASLGGIDVSATVSRSIPVGTSFVDAEKILRAAGFTVAPSPPRPLREGSQAIDTVLRFTIMGGLVLAKEFGYKASVAVTLHPDSPGDSAAHVKEVGAMLRTSHL